MRLVNDELGTLTFLEKQDDSVREKYQPESSKLQRLSFNK